MIKNLSRNDILGFLYVTVSAFCFSSKGVIIKLAYKENIDALSMLNFRMLFAFPFYLVIFFLSRPKNQETKISTNDYLLGITLGIIGYYMSSLFDFYGLEYVSAGVERLVLFIYPTLVALLSAIFFKKKIHRPMLISLFVTYFGVFMVVFYDIKINGTGSLPGIIYIFICAFTFAVYLVFSDKLVHKLGSVYYTSVIMITSSLSVFIHYFTQHSVGDLLVYSNKVYFLGIVLSIFATVLPSYLMTEGIKMIGARNTAITSTLGPIWTIFLANWLLSEQIFEIQIMGTVLVVGGVLYASLNKKPSN
jgi:drug/metabolite transporter (DMT)-like permease